MSSLVTLLGYLGRGTGQASLHLARQLPSRMSPSTTAIPSLFPVVNSFSRPNQSHLLQQASFFSKYISKARKKRLPMTTKRVGRGFSKGNGSRKEGYLTSKGNFIRVAEKCTEIQVPDLTGFKLKAYIAPGLKRNLH